MKSINKTANAAPESQAHSFIAQHPDYALEPRAAGPKNLLDWLVEVDGHARGAARAAYLVGRALVANRPKHGRVAGWLEEQADVLDRSPRTLRLYMQVAMAVDTESATPLPISVLDRPLRDVPAAIRAARGQEARARGPVRRKPRTKSEQWTRSASKLLRSVPATRRRHLLRGLLLDVYRELVRSEPGLATLDDDIASDGSREELLFAVAAAKAVERDKAVPSSALQGRKVLLPFLPYPGGKSKVVDRLTDVMGRLNGDGLNGGHVLREPFVGGGVVSLNMLSRGLAERVWINDTDPGVAAVWNAVLHEHERLNARLMEIRPTPNLVNELMARQDAGDLAGLDLAVAEIVVRRCSFDSVGRMANSARRDVAVRWSPKSTCKRIVIAHHLLSGRVEHGECTSLDAGDVVAAPGQCFIYLDPPYVEAGPVLYPHAFSTADHARLAAALFRTEQPWLLSYDKHGLIEKLYEDHIIEAVPVPPSTKGREEDSEDQKYELLICPRRHSDILRPDNSPNLISELFGVECGVDKQEPTQERLSPDGRSDQHQGGSNRRKRPSQATPRSR